MVFLLYIQQSPYHLLLSTMGSMKVHQYTRGFWEHEPFLTLGCKRLRPLAPKLPNTTQTPSAFDLKSFIRPECGPRKPLSSHDTSKKDPPSHQPHQVETHPGGTRWNPTQEQIGILEMLYKGGMRTPNAQQIEQITVQLGKYGKIEGKNVFYWFQNHKARERQKQKRNSLAFSHTPTPTTINSLVTFDTTSREEDSPYKKKCRRWVFECLEDKNECEEEQRHRTLELFPLHPEGR